MDGLRDLLKNIWCFYSSCCYLTDRNLSWHEATCFKMLHWTKERSLICVMKKLLQRSDRSDIEKIRAGCEKHTNVSFKFIVIKLMLRRGRVAHILRGTSETRWHWVNTLNCDLIHMLSSRRVWNIKPDWCLTTEFKTSSPDLCHVWGESDDELLFCSTSAFSGDFE